MQTLGASTQPGRDLRHRGEKCGQCPRSALRLPHPTLRRSHPTLLLLHSGLRRSHPTLLVPNPSLRSSCSTVPLSHPTRRLWRINLHTPSQLLRQEEQKALREPKGVRRSCSAPQQPLPDHRTMTPYCKRDQPGPEAHKSAAGQGRRGTTAVDARLLDRRCRRNPAGQCTFERVVSQRGKHEPSEHGRPQPQTSGGKLGQSRNQILQRLQPTHTHKCR